MYHTSHLLKRQRAVEDSLSLVTEWKLFGTGPAMVEAFKAASIDLGYIGLPPAMIGIAKGIPLRCIGGGHVEGTIMIARNNYASFENLGGVEPVLQQFIGKKIGSPSKGSIHDVIIRFLLKELQVTGVAVLNFPWADLIPAAIAEGEIDGAVGTPPLAVLANKFYGHSVVICPSYLWKFNPSYGIVVREEMFAESKLLEDYLELHEKACNLIREKPQEAAGILEQEVKVVDSSFIVKTFAVSPKYCASLPEEYIEATLAFIPVLKQMGYIEYKLTKDEVFDLTYIQKVHPEPHHYTPL
jgi:NitT/TauT family transport system substrate-binding protein